MNVLLASDGSWYALQAARFLGRILPRRSSVRIDLTTVLESSRPSDAGSSGLSADQGKRWWAENEAWLEVADAALQGPNIRVKRQTLTGGAAEVLVSSSSAYDLVVAGVKGESGEDFVDLGIVARALLRHAESSVLLVRDRRAKAGPDELDPGSSPPRVLLPSDSSECGLAAARARLAGLSMRYDPLEVITVRDAGSGIGQRAAEIGADLIVLGATGDGPTGPAPLETMDREVAWRAPCSVLMLRPAARRAQMRERNVRARPGSQEYLVTGSTSAA